MFFKVILDLFLTLKIKNPVENFINANLKKKCHETACKPCPLLFVLYKNYSPQSVLDFATVWTRPTVELQRDMLLQRRDTVRKLTNSSAVTPRPQQGNCSCFMSDLHILSILPHLACVSAHEKPEHEDLRSIGRTGIQEKPAEQARSKNKPAPVFKDEETQ